MKPDGDEILRYWREIGAEWGGWGGRWEDMRGAPAPPKLGLKARFGLKTKYGPSGPNRNPALRGLGMEEIWVLKHPALTGDRLKPEAPSGAGGGILLNMATTSPDTTKVWCLRQGRKWRRYRGPHPRARNDLE